MDSGECRQTFLTGGDQICRLTAETVICGKPLCAPQDPTSSNMQYRFYVPEELQLPWKTLAAHYGPYLPDIQMDSDSFLAHPEQAVDLLRELRELSDHPKVPNATAR